MFSLNPNPSHLVCFQETWNQKREVDNELKRKCEVTYVFFLCSLNDPCLHIHGEAVLIVFLIGILNHKTANLQVNKNGNW